MVCLNEELTANSAKDTKENLGVVLCYEMQGASARREREWAMNVSMTERNGNAAIRE